MAKNIGFILGSFHKVQVEEMFQEAKNTAQELGLNIVEKIWVPGSYEKPLALKRLLARKDIDCAAVLGIIEKGETKHGLVMAHVVMGAIVGLELKYMKPVGIGTLGPEILPEQINSRLKLFARKAVKAAEALINKD